MAERERERVRQVLCERKAVRVHEWRRKEKFGVCGVR